MQAKLILFFLTTSTRVKIWPVQLIQAPSFISFLYLDLYVLRDDA